MSAAKGAKTWLGVGKRWEWGSGRVGWREDLMHAQVTRLLLGEEV